MLRFTYNQMEAIFDEVGYSLEVEGGPLFSTAA